MMKFFTNKKIWEKVLLALIFVILFQFAVMEPVQAADVVEFPGKLLNPILSLIVSLCDGIMDILGRTIMGATASLYEVEMGSSFWETLGTILVAVAAAALTVALVVVTAGAAAAALAAIGITASVTVGVGTVVAGVVSGLMAATWFNDEVLPEDVYLPMYTYSAEEIFKGNILLFDVNFFDDVPEIQAKTNEEGEVQYYYYMEDGEEIKTSNQSSVAMLKKTVSSWYNALRNICIVVMLSVLVYIGIRILLATVASDRAKYINMLRDWFVGLCLLFLMHYIMAFSVTLVEKLTDVVKSSVDENAYTVVLQDKDGKLSEAVDEEHLNQPDTIQEENGEKYLYWPTNLMGSLRLQLQMEQYGAQFVGLSICFLMLTFFTLYFTFVYLKRVLYMAFLTLISPMVALTYCIDKLNDGSAQGFNKWFKEYIFNLLIQPMHLLLYYILVTSAFELAGQNVIYSIVAIGFMIPAERLLRSLFGFEKASTPGMMNSAAGAALATTAIHKLTGLVGKGGKGSGSGNNASSANTSDDNTPLRTNDVDVTSQMLGAGQGNNEQQQDREAIARYNSEGYGQNANGNYYNPYIDDYDENYNPINDPNYNNSRYELENNSNDGSNNNDNNLDSQINSNNIRMQQGSNGDADNNEPPKKERFRKAKRILRANVAANKVKFKRDLSKLPQLPNRVAGIALGATAGAAGIALAGSAAAASGDPSKVATAAATGIGAGYLVGKAAINSNNSLDPEVKQAYERMYNAPEYKEDMMQEQIKRLKKDETIRQKMVTELGKDKTKEMMAKGGHFEQFTRNGVDDIDDIIAAQKLIDKGTFNNVDHATAVIQNDKRMGRKDPNKMSKKTRNEWEDTFREEYRNAGASEAKANSTVRNTMNLVHELHKAKK